MDRIAERIRRAAGEESGFTLIELLVVMLVLGVLASIALPAFFNQKGKANDAKAKEMAHTVQVAMETCMTSNTLGSYTSCSATALRAIEPTIPTTGVAVETPVTGGYAITITAPTENSYLIVRGSTGAMTYPCKVKTSSNRAGCPGSGAADGTWG